MKPKPDDEPEDDSTLFRRAIGAVKPLAPSRRVTSEAPKPRPRARLARAEQSAGLEESVHGCADEPDLQAADPSHFARAGVPHRTLRKLRRGEYRVQAQLDLHGLSAAQAKVHLRDFLIAALQHNLRCLRIVHGKGLRSGSQGPVLRTLVNSVLRRTAQVVAFTSARPVDGGTGALYVLLTPKR